MIISVAMATYNGEKYIQKQLDSIVRQTVKVDEVIINDDCSTDLTIKIITDFIAINKLDNWKVSVNKRNLGFSKNFYQSIKKTTGDIIFLADQDDVWCSNKVETIQGTFNNDEKLKVVASNQAFIDSNSNNYVYKNDIERMRKPYKKIANNRYLPFSCFIGGASIAGCTMCICKEIRQFLFDFEAPDLSLSLGHDWYLVMIGTALGKFNLLDEVLIKRRIHESNASKERQRKKTVLTSTVEKRFIYLEQIIKAHQFILDNEVLKNKLTHQDIKGTKQMLRFFKKRLEFKTSNNFFIWISLGFNFLKYFQCAKSVKGGIRLFIADLFYAYNINWKILNTNILK